MDFGLNGKIALICGGSSGLGKAVAEGLVAEGVRVALNGRDLPRIDAAAAEIRVRTPGCEVRSFAADVSRAADAGRLVGQVQQDMGGLDILLCNAGGPPPGAFEEHEPAAWQAALELNLLSTVHLCRAAVPLMRSRGWGRVLCVASIAAKQPAKGLILSTTVRAGVLGFAKALADEVAGNGVTVNVLCPGYIATERLQFLAAERGRRQGRPVDEMLAEQTAGVPMGRTGRPEEFAAVAVFLSSERASYLTGTALSVDGGLHRSIL